MSHVNCALIKIFRILGPIKFCKGPIDTSKGPFKLCDLHVFEWDIGPLAHFKGPSSFWSRIIPNLSVIIERMYVNSSN